MAEEIFLAALLQDIGMLALDRAVPDLYRGGEALQRDHAALAEAERKRLRTDHAEVGGWLMRRWNLPDRLHVAIGHSHRLDLSFTADPKLLFERCVALSGPVADLFLADPSERRFAETALSAERSLGLDRLAFGQMLGTVGAMIPETEAIFEFAPLAQQHPELILEQAREALMLRSLHALREINTLRAAAESSRARALELEEKTRRDALTGIYNRTHLEKALAHEFEHSTRHKWPLSIALVDLDDFKRINDRFGQRAGDRILQATARLIRGNTRETDLIGRCGGEEFVLILPATDAATARAVCERLIVAFQNTDPLVGPDQARVTLCMGCATHGGETSFANTGEFLKAAGQALAAAKSLGRNRTVPFDRHIPATLAATLG